MAAAERAGVGFIAYTRLAKAQESTNLFAPTHQATENAILETGIPYSFLRNNWYLENEISSIQGVLTGAPWVTSAGDGKVGWALQQDYAEAAAVVLSGRGHENTVYELSGKPLTQKEIAAALGTVLEKEVTVLQLDDAAYAEAMAVPAYRISSSRSCSLSKRASAKAPLMSKAMTLKLLGRPATPINEALAQIVNGLAIAN